MGVGWAGGNEVKKLAVDKALGLIVIVLGR